MKTRIEPVRATVAVLKELGAWLGCAATIAQATMYATHPAQSEAALRWLRELERASAAKRAKATACCAAVISVPCCPA